MSEKNKCLDRHLPSPMTDRSFLTLLLAPLSEVSYIHSAASWIGSLVLRQLLLVEYSPGNLSLRFTLVNRYLALVLTDPSQSQHGLCSCCHFGGNLALGINQYRHRGAVGSEPAAHAHPFLVERNG